MQTATQQMVALDLERNRARQYATMLVHELHEYIPESSRREAEVHLTGLFQHLKIEMTTEEQRRGHGQSEVGK